MRKEVFLFIIFALSIILLISFVFAITFTPGSSGTNSSGCLSTGACTPAPSGSPPTENPSNLAHPFEVTTYQYTTAVYGYQYLNLSFNSIGIDPSSISSITYSLGGSSVAVPKPSFTGYYYNYITSAWVQCGSTILTTSSLQTTTCTLNNLNSINQNLNTTYILIQESSGNGKRLDIGNLEIQLTYNSLVINYPTTNKQIMNNLSTLLNVSAFNNYNNAVWYSWDNGRSNHTLCTSCSVPDAEVITVPRNNSYIISVWANKSDGSKLSQSVNNVTFGIFNNQNPLPSLITPNNSNYSTHYVNLSYNITDDNDYVLNATIYIDGILNKTINNPSINSSNNFTMNFSEGSHSWFIQTTDSDLATINSSNFTFTIDTTYPNLQIDSPINGFTYTSLNVLFNYSVTDSGVGLSSCRWQNDTGSILQVNCNQNFTIIQTAGVHHLRFWVNDTLNNTASSDLTYQITTNAPAINLISPEDGKFFNNVNTTFNFTAIDLNGQTDFKNCSILGNWSGSFIINSSNSSRVMNNTGYIFNMNITDGFYKWNINCTDITGTYSSAGLFNRTFGIDTIYPVGNNMTITTIPGSQAFTFLTNISDTNLDSCTYSIYKNNGSIDCPTTCSSNVAFTCNSLIPSSVSSYGTYKLSITSNDSAGNTINQNLSFTTSAITGGTITGGSGGSNNPKEEKVSDEFFVLNSNLVNTIDIKLAKDSKSPREKTIVFINKGKKSVTLNLSCDTTGTNESSRNISICDYVKFANKTITISPNEDNPTQSSFFLYTPPEADFKEVYYFNIIAKDEISNTYSKLSVSSDIDLLATIFYKFSYWSDFPFKNSALDLTGKKLSYPVFVLALVIGIIVLIGSIMIFQKANLILTGLIIGLILFFSSIILITLII